jgi:hypothetical protein
VLIGVDDEERCNEARNCEREPEEHVAEGREDLVNLWFRIT